MSLSDFQAFKEVMLDYKSQAAAGSAEASMVDAQPTAVGPAIGGTFRASSSASQEKRVAVAAPVPDERLAQDMNT